MFTGCCRLMPMHKSSYPGHVHGLSVSLQCQYIMEKLASVHPDMAHLLDCYMTARSGMYLNDANNFLLSDKHHPCTAALGSSTLLI